MKHQTFDSYLQAIHAEDYHGTDDDMPDAYEAWVSGLDVQEVIDFAEDYGEKQFELGCSKQNPNVVS